MALSKENAISRCFPANAINLFFTQMDYFTFTFLTLDHWLNTFLLSSEVLLNAWRPA